MIIQNYFNGGKMNIKNIKLIVVWLVLPFILLVVIGVYNVNLTHRTRRDMGQIKRTMAFYEDSQSAMKADMQDTLVNRVTVVAIRTLRKDVKLLERYEKIWVGIGSCYGETF